MSKKCECSVGTPDGPVPCQNDAVVNTADRSYCAAHFARWSSLSDEQRVEFSTAWRRYKENSQPAPLSEDNQKGETVNNSTYFRNSTLAFPKTAEYGCAIQRFQRRVSWVRVLLILTILMSGAYLLS